jgi:undecaprenyl-diphosphatase 1
MQLWVKIIVACFPAAIVGILLDDWVDKHLYNPTTVAIMLILVGIAFIFVEKKNVNKEPRITSLRDISYKDALIIGAFQLIAAVLPGTSRSGSTIIGGLLIGIDRTIAAEFTFFLAIPVMFGASLLKLLKFGLHFTALEFGILFVGIIVSFLVSLFCIKLLMAYVKKHDFKVFGWYRIALGAIVLIYFKLMLA